MYATAWPALQIQPLHIAALIAVAVFVIAMLAGQRLRVHGTVRRRATDTSSLFVGGASIGQSIRTKHEQRASRLVARIGRLMAPSERVALAAHRKELIQAGYFTSSAVTVLHATRLVLAAALPLVFLVSLGWLPFVLPQPLTMMLVVCFAILGLILPPIYVDYRRGVMQQKYRHAFPDFMDLLVVCVESGQSLQSALVRVGYEMLQICPELGANLHLVSLELRAGSTLPAALKGLSERIGLEEVQSLAVLLKQSEELGSGIALTLRTYSDEMRDKRLSRAETRANALPVKMTIPLGLFVFPVILLVIMVPALIRIKNAFV